VGVRQVVVIIRTKGTGTPLSSLLCPQFGDQRQKGKKNFLGFLCKNSFFLLVNLVEAEGDACLFGRKLGTRVFCKSIPPCLS
jgi:hypothetical protein